MRKRVRKKISKKFLDIDELLSFAFVAGWIYETKILRRDIQKLKRRYPRIYFETFYSSDPRESAKYVSDIRGT